MADNDVGSSDASQNIFTSISSSEPSTLLVERPYGYISTKRYNDVDLSLSSSELDKSQPEGTVIRGLVRNVNPKEIGVVVIVFNLFDASGNQVGNAYASVDFLSPRTNWRFVTEPILRSDVQFHRFAYFFTGSYETGL
jgi:hypothetical protein